MRVVHFFKNAAGIWGLESGEILERVQQQYFKKVLKLPFCTPKYFIRLETGRSHLSHETLKLALAILKRILNSPPESLLYQSFVALRRVSLLFPDPKFSWYLQLREILVIVKEEAIIDKCSANYLYFCRERVIRKHRWSLGEQDLESARKSTSIPHYDKLVSSIFAEPYLMTALPQYIVTCVAQLRLNYSIIFNQGSWHNLGMFELRGCKFCDERDSFNHLFSCSHYKQLRIKLLSPDMDFDVTAVTATRNIDLEACKNIYIFINAALKLRSL